MGTLITRYVLDCFVFICLIHCSVSMLLGKRALSLCHEIIPIEANSEHLFNCLVPSGHILDYREIRRLTASASGNQKFNVSIECQGGRVKLPYPFRARNVVSLSVYGCDIEDYYTEREAVISDNPDELRNISMVNVAILMSSKELLDMVTQLKSVSRAFECGLGNARQQVFRNVKYVFPDITNFQNDMLLMEALMNTDLEQQIMQPKYMCSFPHLDYLEQSGSRSLSKAHFKLFENNNYPVLRAFVFRNNSLPKIPQEMENLNLGFLPNLEVLDFSDNEIPSADFVFTGIEPRDKLLYIDLRRNRIQHLSSKSVEHVVKSGKVILDLRDNPLQCSCELNIYKEYLVQHGGLNARFLADLQCSSTDGGITTTHSVLETNFGKKFCSQLLPQVVKNMTQFY